MKILKNDTALDASLPPGSAWPTEAEIRAADLESDDTARRQTEAELRPTDAEAEREARIRAAAYACYQRRGGTPGHAVEDWLQGEREVDGEPGGNPGGTDRR